MRPGRLLESDAGRRLDQATRPARERLAKALQRRLAPAAGDAAPAEPGRGPHPLGAVDVDADTTDEALAPLGAEALAAGRGTAVAFDPSLPGQLAVDALACRLIHLAALHAWQRLDGDRARQLGGAVRAHVAVLRAERPVGRHDADAALVDAAISIAGFAFPALPEAADWRRLGLAALGRSASAAFPDGAPVSDAARGARALWALALARAWVEAAGGALPADATAALVRGSNALWHMVGDSPGLPAEETLPALLPLGARPLPHTLRDLVLAWGLDEGRPASAAPGDAAVLRLAGRAPAGTPAPMAPDGTWRLWSWRESGAAVAHARVKGHAGRMSWRAADGLLRWDLDGVPVVRGHRDGLRLSVARVDGPKARVIAVPDGVDREADGRPERDITVRQARLIVHDRGVPAVSWRLGSDWRLSPGDKAGQWTAEAGERTLVVKLEGEGWEWRVDGDRIQGHGPEDQEAVSYFELR